MPEETVTKPLSYDISHNGENTLVKCEGHLVAGLTDGFYQELKDVASTSKVLVLDLEDLTYVDSMGLGTLVRLYVHARSAGCEPILNDSRVVCTRTSGVMASYQHCCLSAVLFCCLFYISAWCFRRLPSGIELPSQLPAVAQRPRRCDQVPTAMHR